MAKIDSPEALFEKELRDMYDAEKRLTKALPKVAKAVSSEDLKSALQEHLEVTKNQVARLEEVFRLCDLKARAKQCAGMVGLIEEAEEIMDEDGEEILMDLAIAAAARKVENYEITAYRTLQMLAESIGGDPRVQELLGENLQEEEETDQQLAALCTELLESAGQGADEEEDEEIEEEEEEHVTTGAGRRR